MKRIEFWVWTVVCVAAAVILISLSNRDEIKTGEDMMLTITEQQYVIINKTAMLQAASNDFFALRKASGEVIVGVPTEVPLGWEAEMYFTSEPTMVQGEWIVEKGDSVTLRLTSEENNSIRVALKERSKFFGGFLSSLLALLIWGLGLLVHS